MESHDALVIKLRDCKPKALLFTRHILYQLLSSPTSRDYILATKNSGAVNICGFTCICEQSYVEFRTFFQFVSLSSVILKRKYNHKKFTYSKSFVRDMLGLGDDEGITEPKLIHEFSGDPYKCGIYISKSDSFDIENEYQSVLKITDSDCNTTFVSMVDSDYILQTFFHPYITILCANPPFDTINNFESGVTIAGCTYKFARHMLTDMCKIVQKISKESKSFDIFVTTIGGENKKENGSGAGALFHLNLGIKGNPEFLSENLRGRWVHVQRISRRGLLISQEIGHGLNRCGGTENAGHETIFSRNVLRSAVVLLERGLQIRFFWQLCDGFNSGRF